MSVFSSSKEVATEEDASTKKKIDAFEKMTRAHLGLESADSVLPSLVDVDCNLNHKDLSRDARFHAKMAALGCGVRYMIIPGSSLKDSIETCELIEKVLVDSPSAGTASSLPRFISTAGVHPYMADAEDLKDKTQSNEDVRKMIQTKIRDIVRGNKCVAAIGECGLDYSEGFPSREAQLRAFEPQLALACEIQMPLFLHERNAFNDMKIILSRQEKDLPPVLVHCFTGSTEELAYYLSRGFYVSFSGIVCKRERGKALRESIRLQQKNLIGRVMVETDAPYLGFSNCRKGHDRKPKSTYPNVPTALPAVVAKIAECLGVPTKSLADASTKAALRFFRVGGDETDRE